MQPYENERNYDGSKNLSKFKLESIAIYKNQTRFQSDLMQCFRIGSKPNLSFVETLAGRFLLV